MAAAGVAEGGTRQNWELTLEGRAYIVSGAASGIGKATAEALAELGAGVVAVDRDATGLAALASLAGTVVTLCGDCVDEDVAKAAVQLAEESFGYLSGLVANVGVAVTARIQELTLATWTKSMSVNLTSHFLMTRVRLYAVWPATRMVVPSYTWRLRMLTVPAPASALIQSQRLEWSS